MIKKEKWVAQNQRTRRAKLQAILVRLARKSDKLEDHKDEIWKDGAVVEGTEQILEVLAKHWEELRRVVIVWSRNQS